MAQNKYFIARGNERLGSFDHNELAAQLIDGDTPVWCEGMSQWLKAREVADLRDLLATLPPPLRLTSRSQATPQRQMSPLGRIKSIIVGFFSLASGLAVTCLIILRMLGVPAARGLLKEYTRQKASPVVIPSLPPLILQKFEEHTRQKASPVVAGWTAHFEDRQHPRVDVAVTNDGGDGDATITVLTHDGNLLGTLPVHLKQGSRLETTVQLPSLDSVSPYVKYVNSDVQVKVTTGFNPQ